MPSNRGPLARLVPRQRIGEIHIAYVQGFERPDPRDIGFDAAVEFPPNLSNPANLTAGQQLLNPEFAGQALDWRELAGDYSARPMPAYRLYPGVNAGWDNEPRRPGKGASTCTRAAPLSRLAAGHHQFAPGSRAALAPTGVPQRLERVGRRRRAGARHRARPCLARCHAPGVARLGRRRTATLHPTAAAVRGDPRLVSGRFRRDPGCAAGHQSSAGA